MFLIEWDEGKFIDGEKISNLKIGKGRVAFEIMGEADYVYIVDHDFIDTFLNHLSAINENMSKIQTRYEEISNI